MNIRYILIVALFAALVIAYFTWDSTPEISAVTLSAEYQNDPQAANTKYLNKVIRVAGNVKAYYKIMGARPVLELETGDSSVPVFFFFLSQENEFYAGQLQSGQHVIIKGQCVGENQYSFVNGVKIEVEKFVEK